MLHLPLLCLCRPLNYVLAQPRHVHAGLGMPQRQAPTASLMHAQACSSASSDSLPELAAPAVSISGASVHNDDSEDEALDPVTQTLASASLQAEGDHGEAAGVLRDLLVRSLSLSLSQTLTLTLTCTLPYPYPQRGPPVIVSRSSVCYRPLYSRRGRYIANLSSAGMCSPVSRS